MRNKIATARPFFRLTYKYVSWYIWPISSRPKQNAATGKKQKLITRRRLPYDESIDSSNDQTHVLLGACGRTMRKRGKRPNHMQQSNWHEQRFLLFVLEGHRVSMHDFGLWWQLRCNLESGFR